MRGLIVLTWTLMLAACGRSDRVDEARAVPGVSLGPIRLGMSRAEVEALGLPFHYDPSAQAGDQASFAGPFQLVLGADQRVEQIALALSRVRVALLVGTARLEPSDDLARITQKLGSCGAAESYDGGQRVRCAEGLYVEYGQAPGAPPRVRVLGARP